VIISSEKVKVSSFDVNSKQPTGSQG